MVYTPKHEPMSEHDWKIVGKQMRRLEIPLPHTKEGLHTLYWRIGKMLEDWRDLARDESISTRLALLSVGSQVGQMNQELKEIAAEWERDLPKERKAAAEKRREALPDGNIREIRSA